MLRDVKMYVMHVNISPYKYTGAHHSNITTETDLNIYARSVVLRTVS